MITMINYDHNKIHKNVRARNIRGALGLREATKNSNDY